MIDKKKYLSNGSSSHGFPEEDSKSISTKFEQLNVSPCPEKKTLSLSR
jgi:hypothetical protein